MNILFWNTSCVRNIEKKVRINNCLIEIILENKCDVIVLAEYGDEISRLCGLLNMVSKDTYQPLPQYEGCKKIRGLINSKYKSDVLHEQSRYQIIMIETSYYSLIIAMIHNKSKLNSSIFAQEEELRVFHQDICAVEKSCNTKNTLVIGDFNADPFEPACTSASALHAIPFAGETSKSTRTVSGRKYHKFYNPTWKFYSNRSVPYSTYYYNNSDMINLYWNIFDQVIIRPQLINAFIDDSLSIITETKNHNLLKKKIPNKDKYSDHLPLFCSVEEEKII